jgi:hypothetical protein
LIYGFQLKVVFAVSIEAMIPLSLSLSLSVEGGLLSFLFVSIVELVCFVTIEAMIS